MIKIYKHDVIIDGQKKLFVFIRDYADTINIEKSILKHKEEYQRINMIQHELNIEFKY